MARYPLLALGLLLAWVRAEAQPRVAVASCEEDDQPQAVVAEPMATFGGVISSPVEVPARDLGPAPGELRLPSASGSRLSFGKAEVSDGLDVATVRRYLRMRAPVLLRCYERKLATRAGLSGTISARWLVAGDGKVVQVTATGLGDGEVETCVAEVVRGVTFPKPARGAVVEVVMPLTFRPGATAAAPAPPPRPPRPPGYLEDLLPAALGKHAALTRCHESALAADPLALALVQVWLDLGADGRVRKAVVHDGDEACSRRGLEGTQVLRPPRAMTLRCLVTLLPAAQALPARADTLVVRLGAKLSASQLRGKRRLIVTAPDDAPAAGLLPLLATAEAVPFEDVRLARAGTVVPAQILPRLSRAGGVGIFVAVRPGETPIVETTGPWAIILLHPQASFGALVETVDKLQARGAATIGIRAER